MELIYIGTTVGGLILGVVVTVALNKSKQKKAQQTYADVIKKAQKEAARIQKDAQYKAKEEVQRAQNQMKDQRRRKEQELSSLEKKLLQDEVRLKAQLRETEQREKQFEEREVLLKEKTSSYDAKMNELNLVIEKEMKQLENISQFTKDEAKDWIKSQVRDEARAEAAEMAMRIKNEMKERANREAKDVLAKAIENMSFEYTAETTLTNIPIPNDRVKGMIIGREGKNIRAFEEITGCKIVIDDTPETVTVSGFDPIKRDIASRSLKDLIKNKQINPVEIEKQWKRRKNDVEKEMRKAASDCLRELKMRNVSDEMFEMLGRLKYRTSYGQNILQHSMEVAKLAAHMAGELGLNVDLAKRAGLFHDLGKANSHDAEASHVAIGVEVATRAKEHPIVINAVLSHHEEAEPISPISVLVNAADKISGSRPGARRDSLEQYTKRIEDLERIASSFNGVKKVYALSAGREVRVIVEPNEITDSQADMLSSDIAKQIQESMEFPGTIKVTIIRRSLISAMTDTFGEQQNHRGNNRHNNRNNKRPNNRNNQRKPAQKVTSESVNENSNPS
jgi:ribonuclease Y